MSVAVVITNYNYGRFLRSAVDSVLTQTRRADQVIVVDDGSTDDSEAVLRELPAPVQVIRQANAGVIAARNAGVAASSSRFLVFLDADDTLSPHFLRWTLAAYRLAPLPQIGAVYTPARQVNPTGRGYMHSRPFHRATLRDGNYISNTALIRRDAFNAVGGYSPAFADVGHEDWDFYLRMTAAGWRAALLPVPLFTYRNHGESRNSVSLARGDAHKLVDERHPGRPAPPTVTRSAWFKLVNGTQSAARAIDQRLLGERR